MDKLTIRKTTKDDISKVMPLIEKLNLSDFPYDEQVNVKWGETEKGKEYYYKKIDGTKGVCFLAEIDNEPIGYVMGEIEEADGYRTIRVVELSNIYVKEQFRNQGIGKKLVDAFLDWGKEIGAQKASVSAFTQNAKAMQFYEHEGFKNYSTRFEISLEK
ncbi:MAG TPA: GNAT family N-acetyltransferase [Patescibacteria group bacterium]|nr:GNAT family N-acetyltransferase [Patescibacteria group bacterium]